ncbi:glycosyltransferase [Desulfovibrio sp. Huiquan2017]|uniref:glycosyltransferase n=1 Tax=Desulfovibrio sp. Huiquan2017 TaxID=2816861 RepID=UPI002570BFCD|nr:glycosyltransferase [Desulfovibrio sp. Huiquan2017]
MNILFVNSTRKWGGVKTWCIDMAESLIRQGHKTWIIGRPGPFVDKAARLGIPATGHSFGFDLNPVSIAFFLRFLSRNKIDVVICNISKELRTAGIAAKMLGIPVVHRLGAPGDVENEFKTRATQRLLGAHLLACSDFVLKHLKRSVPIFQEYDFTAIFPGTRPNPHAPSHNHVPRTIIATSQLNKDKGHPHLLKALAALKNRGYEFRCIIVGTGKDEARLKGLCRSLGLTDAVEWTGFVTDVQAELAKADIFVLPTFCEPLGIALEEAMAHGLIPVARNIGGPTEIWPPDMRELLIPPKSNEAGFEKTLAQLLDLPDDELFAMKLAVRDHAAATFSLDTQARKFLAWLEPFAG